MSIALSTAYNYIHLPQLPIPSKVYRGSSPTTEEVRCKKACIPFLANLSQTHRHIIVLVQYLTIGFRFHAIKTQIIFKYYPHHIFMTPLNISLVAKMLVSKFVQLQNDIHTTTPSIHFDQSAARLSLNFTSQFHNLCVL